MDRVFLVLGVGSVAQRCSRKSAKRSSRKSSGKSENLFWGVVLRSRTVSVRGPAAYREKALIFFLANPRLTYQGFATTHSARPAVAPYQTPCLEGFTAQIFAPRSPMKCSR